MTYLNIFPTNANNRIGRLDKHNFLTKMNVLLV